MKKDMGGAAIAMGLGYLVMSQALPVRLRLLIPAAENAVAGNAFRPGDVLQTHKGLTVGNHNTDAEGRLLLCDALSMASSEQPELIVDYATLTGAARGAVGAEIAAMFCTDDGLAQANSSLGRAEDDAVWPMPLHAGYDYMLKSHVADLVNSAASPYAGAVTAALFLKHFIDEVPWVHFDVMAFNIRKRPAALKAARPWDYAKRLSLFESSVSEPTMNSIKDLENAASGTQVDLSRFLGWVSFNEQGLVPAIAQDHTTGSVLMLAWITARPLNKR